MFKVPKWARLLASIVGGWWSLMSGAISIPFAFAALFSEGHPRRYFALLAFVALWVFVIRVVWKNYQMLEANKRELDAQKNLHAKEKQNLVVEHIEQRQVLEKIIESLRTPLLEIESVDSDIVSAHKQLCQIRILNRSSTVTADNVKVELIALEDELEHSVQEQHFRPAFPVILNSQTGENIINPGSLLVYRLFHVMMNDGWFRAENSQEMIPYRRIFAYFTPGQTTQNLTHFLWRKSYRLKLKVTARDFSKTEQEFNLTFSEHGSLCRFSITKI